MPTLLLWRRGCAYELVYEVTWIGVTFRSYDPALYGRPQVVNIADKNALACPDKLKTSQWRNGSGWNRSGNRAQEYSRVGSPRFNTDRDSRSWLLWPSSQSSMGQENVEPMNYHWYYLDANFELVCPLVDSPVDVGWSLLTNMKLHSTSFHNQFAGLNLGSALSFFVQNSLEQGLSAFF